MGTEKLTSYERLFIQSARQGSDKILIAIMAIATVIGFFLVWHATRFSNESEFVLAIVILFISYPSLTLIANHRVWLKIYDKVTKE